MLLLNVCPPKSRVLPMPLEKIHCVDKRIKNIPGITKLIRKKIFLKFAINYINGELYFVELLFSKLNLFRSILKDENFKHSI